MNVQFFQWGLHMCEWPLNISAMLIRSPLDISLFASAGRVLKYVFAKYRQTSAKLSNFLSLLKNVSEDARWYQSVTACALPGLHLMNRILYGNRFFFFLLTFSQNFTTVLAIKNTFLFAGEKCSAIYLLSLCEHPKKRSYSDVNIVCFGTLCFILNVQLEAFMLVSAGSAQFYPPVMFHFQIRLSQISYIDQNVFKRNKSCNSELIFNEIFFPQDAFIIGLSVIMNKNSNTFIRKMWTTLNKCKLLCECGNKPLVAMFVCMHLWDRLADFMSKGKCASLSFFLSLSLVHYLFLHGESYSCCNICIFIPVLSVEVEFFNCESFKKVFWRLN